MNYKNLGITDEVTDCSCCGKQNLKCTVAFEIEETGEIVYYGRTCASRNTGRPSKVINTEARSAYNQRHIEATRIYHESIPYRVQTQIINKLNELDRMREPGWIKIRLQVLKPVGAACHELKEDLIKRYRLVYIV